MMLAIHHIENNTLSENEQEQIKKYANDDKVKAIETLKNKIEIIKNQEANKDCFIVYAYNDKFKSSFNYPNLGLYNYILMNGNIDFIYNNIDKLNFSEHNYTNYSRIFFDIDFDNMDNIEDLKTTFEIMNNIKEEYKLNVYGLIEFNKSKIDIENEDYEWLNKFDDDDEVFYCNNEQINKILTGHIYFNGYCERCEIMKFMNYMKIKYNVGKTFDTSVYKTTKQAFRMSYSQKVSTDEKKLRPISKGLINCV